VHILCLLQLQARQHGTKPGRQNMVSCLRTAKDCRTSQNRYFTRTWAWTWKLHPWWHCLELVVELVKELDRPHSLYLSQAQLVTEVTRNTQCGGAPFGRPRQEFLYRKSECGGMEVGSLSWESFADRMTIRIILRIILC